MLCQKAQNFIFKQGCCSTVYRTILQLFAVAFAAVLAEGGHPSGYICFSEVPPTMLAFQIELQVSLQMAAI